MGQKAAKEGAAPWPVTLQPWSDGKRFTVRGLPPRFSTKYRRWVIPPLTLTFYSDLTSSPLLSRPVVPLWGLWGLAALYHDLLYRNKLPGFTRKMADQIMLEFMLEDGVAEWRAYLIYAALRVGGRGDWHGATK